MMRKAARIRKTAQRATFLDVIHLAAIISCSLWTTKVIVEDRFGSVQTAAARVMNGMRASPVHPILTIRLDEINRTAAR